jgi:hypothetical protein
MLAPGIGNTLFDDWNNVRMIVFDDNWL